MKLTIKGNVNVTTEIKLAEATSTLAHGAANKRLAIIVSNANSALQLEIPPLFTSLEIRATKHHEIYLSPKSSYCGISLTAWNRRTTHCTHELILHGHVYLEVPGYDPAENETPPPFSFQDEEDIPTAASAIREVVEKDTAMPVTPRQSSVLPWLAGGAGAVTSAATAIGMVSHFKFSAWGAYVSYGPLTAAAGNVAASGSLAMAGMASLGIGVGVAAAVYFIPWKKLAGWAVKAWDLFLVFVKSVWKFFKVAWDKFISFLKMLMKAVKAFVVAVTRVVKWGVSSVFGSTIGGKVSAEKMARMAL